MFASIRIRISLRHVGLIFQMPVANRSRPVLIIRMSERTNSSAAIVVLYDGDCGLCHRSVRFILRHERDRVLKFAALDSPYALNAMAKHGPAEAPRDTMVVLAGDRVLMRSDAALFIAGHLCAPWRWLRIFRVMPCGWRDALYDFTARRRHRWFARPEEACPMPDAASRSRFLD